MTSLGRARWYAYKDFYIRHGKTKPKHFTYKQITDVFNDPELKTLPPAMKLYYMFPKPYMYELAYRVTNPAQPLDILRKQILMARAEFWFRKVTTYPHVVNAAYLEGKYLWGLLRDPLSMTGTHLQWLFCLVVHCFGTFLIGEMFGRGKIGGYGIVSPDWFSSDEGFRFSPASW